MFISELTTANPAVKLVAPDITRDPPISVEWLAGDPGRCTLRLMGVAENQIEPTSLEQETGRVQDFLESKNQYNWMIQYGDHIVGSIWVDLEPAPEIKAPAISIMIGDPAVRGHGVGAAAMSAVIEFLTSQSHKSIHSRHLINNVSSAALLRKVGFMDDGAVYVSPDDGYQWQNTLLLVE